MSERLLFQSSKSGDHLAVRSLLSTSPAVDLNWKNSEEAGQTALLAACQKGHVAVIQELLLSPSVNVMVTDNRGLSAITTCIGENHDEALRCLLQDQRVTVPKLFKAAILNQA